MKEILLVTRPIAPPWDEASKNFAYFIAKNLKDIETNLMTKGILPELPANIKQHPIYTTSEISEFNLEQKLRSLYFQFKTRGQFNINHYFFTPTKLNSFLIKNFLIAENTKIIQTVATLREDLWSDDDMKNLLFGDLIITYSDYAKNKLEKIGIKNVERIYPGIDTEKYSPAPKNLETMKLFGIKNSDFIVSYNGEYTRLGATDDLVSMLPDLFAKIPNAKFVFALRIKNEKDARKKDEIVKILHEKGIFEKVVFTDTFADMPKIYNMSDLILFPAQDMKGKFDVPLVVIEAFACEKPVIISDLPILQEFSSEKNSLVVPVGNSKMLLDSIVELFGNKEKCEKIGKAARVYAVENFDIKDVAEQYEKAYNKLLSK